MLFQLYPSIPAYIDRTKWELNTFGLVETYFGRRRRFAVKGATGYLRSRAERQGVNFKIQSTSSDIVLNCLINVEKPLINELRGRLLLTVHDSIGFEVPKKYVSQIPDFVDQYLNIKPGTRYPWLPTEFKWDYEIGPNYGEMNSYETYVSGLQKEEEERNAADDAYSEEEVRDELASLE
jgi:DNA polymerase I-like protein with 3'-5' exonuclease and polymerase domains